MRFEFAIFVGLVLLSGSHSFGQIVRDNAPRFPARRVPANPAPTLTPPYPDPGAATYPPPGATYPPPGTAPSYGTPPVYNGPQYNSAPPMTGPQPQYYPAPAPMSYAAPAPMNYAPPAPMNYGASSTGGPWALPTYVMPPLYDNYPTLSDDPFAICEGCGKSLHRTRRRPPRQRIGNRLLRNRVDPHFELDRDIFADEESCGPDGCDCTCHGRGHSRGPRRARASGRAEFFEDDEDEFEMDEEFDCEDDECEDCDDDGWGVDFGLHMALPQLPKLAPLDWLKPSGFAGTVTTVFGRGDSLGITTYEIRPKFALSRHPGFEINPFFNLNNLNGPKRVDVPSNLYEYGLEFHWMKALSEEWSFDLSIAPGYYNDSHFSNGKTIRTISRGVLNWRESDEWSFVLGYIYLARKDVVGLPIVGGIYTPNDSTRWELIFPRPRVYRRVHWRNGGEQWFYVGGEFGGGTWGYEMQGGAKDFVTYRDLRLVLGLETKGIRGVTTRLEGGYVFNRSLDFDSPVQADYRPSNTGFLRVGVSY